MVDTTGRIIRDDKRGAIDENTETILSRLHFTSENWLKLSTEFGRIFTGAVGTPEHLSEFVDHVGLTRRHGISHCKRWLSYVS